MRRTICAAVGLAAAFLLTAAQASAASPAPAGSDPALTPISDSDLAEMSGGQATTPSSISMVLTDQSQTATNGNNTVSAGGNVGSGDVTLGQNAFQGFAGVGNFVINTGHNNNLQGNLSVAINLAPAGTP
jgi:hypothetical protein